MTNKDAISRGVSMYYDAERELGSTELAAVAAFHAAAVALWRAKIDLADGLDLLLSSHKVVSGPSLHPTNRKKS